jgi:tetratricopeptide (TPR) repeat protein
VEGALHSLCRVAPGIVVAAVLAGAPAGHAHAAPADEAAQFKEHFERGQVNYDLKEYAAALEEFKSAYRYKQDPVMLYNIAQCHFFLGHNDEALGFYRNYLRRSPDAPNKGAVERKIQELERRIASGAKAPVAPATAPPAVTSTRPTTGTPAPPPQPDRRLLPRPRRPLPPRLQRPRRCWHPRPSPRSLRSRWRRRSAPGRRHRSRLPPPSSSAGGSGLASVCWSRAV